MEDLNRYVTIKYATQWYDIGIELGLRFDLLDIIKRNNPLKSTICFQKTIDKWLELNSENATWKKLEFALTNVNRTNLGLDPVDEINPDDDACGMNVTLYIHMYTLHMHAYIQ